MSELDQKITAELARMAEVAPQQPHPSGTEVNKTMELVIQQNEKTKRKLWRWTLAWHAFLTVTLLIGVWNILRPAQSEDTSIGLFISMAALAGFIVIKVVYYLTRTRLHLETKLKELELSIAEVRDLLKNMKS
jgi:hypothetical protein